MSTLPYNHRLLSLLRAIEKVSDRASNLHEEISENINARDIEEGESYARSPYEIEDYMEAIRILDDVVEMLDQAEHALEDKVRS